MRDKHSDILRVGKVSSIDYENCTAQVVFEDRHDLVSGDLHILVPLTLKDHVYYMPDIDERVVCWFDPSAPTKGYIVGSYYADTRLPPIQNKDKRYIKFEDETLIEYDRELHTITISIPEGGEKSIDIFAESDINVKTNGKINIESAKDINVETAENITVNTAEKITVTAGSSIEIGAAQQIKITSAQPIFIQSSEFVQIQGAETTLVVP